MNESRMRSNLLRVYYAPVDAASDADSAHLRTASTARWEGWLVGVGWNVAGGAHGDVAAMATCICTKILRDSAIRTQLLFDVARVRLLSAPFGFWQIE